MPDKSRYVVGVMAESSQKRELFVSTRAIIAASRELLAEPVPSTFLGRTCLERGAHESQEDRQTSSVESAALIAVGQRLDRAGDAMARCREMLLGTFDVHMTRMAQRTNDTMRVLTLASVILLPAVVLAGVMGMNFQVGLFDQPDLFYVVIGLMVVMATATVLIARWRHWL